GNQHRPPCGSVPGEYAIEATAQTPECRRKQGSRQLEQRWHAGGRKSASSEHQDTSHLSRQYQRRSAPNTAQRRHECERQTLEQQRNTHQEQAAFRRTRRGLSVQGERKAEPFRQKLCSQSQCCRRRTQERKAGKEHF